MSPDNVNFSFRDDVPGVVTEYVEENINDGAGQRRYFRMTSIKTGEGESVPTEPKYPITAQDRTVMLSADVSEIANGEITLNWYDNPLFTSYDVYSRTSQQSAWGSPRATGLTDGTWTDTQNIQSGVAKEYRVVATSSVNFGFPQPTGYIRVGADVSLDDASRGTVLLVIDETKSADLIVELEQYKRDLIADRWKVGTIEVDRDDGNYETRLQAAQVKQQILSFYSTHSDLKSIVLIGHVPVPFSGFRAVDNHGASGDSHVGAWACDMYYGDFDGTWSDISVNTDALPVPPTYVENRNVDGDGKFDQDYIPGNQSFWGRVEASVGRIDFAKVRFLVTQRTSVSEISSRT